MEFDAFKGADDFEEFRKKARQFLREHEDHIAIHKLRMNEPLTAGDLAELERILAESGVGSAKSIERAKAESEGLGCSFDLSLVSTAPPRRKPWPASWMAGRRPPIRSNLLICW
jgi:type I restriction enzyme R subunit